MSKTRDTGFINNVVKYDANGNVSIVSGSTTLLSISSSGAITTTGVISGSNALSASYAQTGTSASYAVSATSASYALNATSASWVTGSNVIGVVSNTTSASFATQAQTASFANTFTVNSTLTAQTLVVQTVTSSIVYSSGSNIFGNTISNTQTFTGSVLVTGSVGIGTSSPLTIFDIRVPYAKTDTTRRDILFSSNESSPSGLRISITGGASQAARSAHLQTTDWGVTNDGIIALQPYGGSIGIGTSSPTNGKVEIQQNATTSGLWVQTGGTTNSYVIADFRTGTNLPALQILGNGASSFGGATTFSSTIIATGSITTTQTLFSTKNIVAGEATPLHLNYTSSDGNGPAIRLGSGTQGFWDIQPSSNNQRLTFDWNDTVNVLSVLASGSVGIGTTNPTAISSDVKLGVTNGSLIVDTENNTYGGLKIYTDSSGDYNVYIVQGRGGAAGGIRFLTNGRPSGGGAFTGSGNERLTILGTGNVGIGVTSPDTKLEIRSGDLKLSDPSSNINAGYDLSWASNSGGTNVTYASIQGITTSAGNRTGDIIFKTGNAGAPGEKMRIRSNGGVSIQGTSCYISMDGGGLSGPPSGLGYGLYPHSGIGLGYYSVATGHVWYVTASPVSRMYLNSNNLFVGPQQTTSYSERVNIAGGLRVHTGNEWDGVGITATGTRVYYDHTGAEDDAQWLFFGVTKFTLYSNGNYSFAGSNVSDLRLKSNIQKITSPYLNKINQLEVSSFTMNNDETNTTKLGFIAQEVKEVVPEIVTGDETKEHEYLGVDTNGLLALAIKSIQELKAENDTLKEILQRNNIQ